MLPRFEDYLFLTILALFFTLIQILAVCWVQRFFFVCSQWISTMPCPLSNNLSFCTVIFDVHLQFWYTFFPQKFLWLNWPYAYGFPVTFLFAISFLEISDLFYELPIVFLYNLLWCLNRVCCILNQVRLLLVHMSSCWYFLENICLFSLSACS